MPDFQQRPFFIRVLVPTGDPDAELDGDEIGFLVAKVAEIKRQR